MVRLNKTRLLSPLNLRASKRLSPCAACNGHSSLVQQELVWQTARLMRSLRTSIEDSTYKDALSITEFAMPILALILRLTPGELTNCLFDPWECFIVRETDPHK